MLLGQGIWGFRKRTVKPRSVIRLVIICKKIRMNFKKYVWMKKCRCKEKDHTTTHYNDPMRDTDGTSALSSDVKNSNSSL